jgi:hypothetical protein
MPRYYEAENLKVCYHTSDELTYLLGIVKTVESEVVIMLKDKSLFCDNEDIESANTLNGFVRDFTFKKKSIVHKMMIKLQVSYVDILLEI